MFPHHSFVALWLALSTAGAVVLRRGGANVTGTSTSTHVVFAHTNQAIKPRISTSLS